MRRAQRVFQPLMVFQTIICLKPCAGLLGAARSLLQAGDFHLVALLLQQLRYTLPEFALDDNFPFLDGSPYRTPLLEALAQGFEVFLATHETRYQRHGLALTRLTVEHNGRLLLIVRQGFGLAGRVQRFVRKALIGRIHDTAIPLFLLLAHLQYFGYPYGRLLGLTLQT